MTTKASIITKKITESPSPPVIRELPSSPPPTFSNSTPSPPGSGSVSGPSSSAQPSFHPNQNTCQTKQLTCFFWFHRNGLCTNNDRCKYAHHWAAGMRVAEKPQRIPGMTRAVAGHNLARIQQQPQDSQIHEHEQEQEQEQVSPEQKPKEHGHGSPAPVMNTAKEDTETPPAFLWLFSDATQKEMEDGFKPEMDASGGERRWDVRVGFREMLKDAERPRWFMLQDSIMRSNAVRRLWEN